VTYRKLVEGTIIFPDYLEKIGQKLSYYLTEIINNKIQISRGNYFYVLCKCKELVGDKFDGGTNPLLFAIMLKMSRTTKELYFDEENWLPKEEELERRHIKTYSRFLLFSSNLIVLEDARPQLSRHTFVDILKLLLEKVVARDVGVFQLDVRFKKSKEEIVSFIEKCDYITSIKFIDLYTPNPYDFGAEKINKARDIIKRGKIKNLSVENPSGLEVESDEISGVVGLVQSGMGDAKVKGKHKESTEYLETRSKLKSKKVEIEDDDDFIQEAHQFAEEEG
jgi:hypothetical protein